VAPDGSRPTLELRAVFDHLAFLLSSAELCMHEPHYYGTMRLLDGASRFAKALVEAGLDDAKLTDLIHRIEEAKSARKSDPESFRRLLHRLPATVAEAIMELPLAPSA
jgi:uncharacterized protein DUF6092